MKERTDPQNLTLIRPVRMFPLMQERITKIVSINQDRWEDSSAFIRAAIHKFLHEMEEEEFKRAQLSARLILENKRRVQRGATTNKFRGK